MIFVTELALIWLCILGSNETTKLPPMSTAYEDEPGGAERGGAQDVEVFAASTMAKDNVYVGERTLH